MPSYSPVLKSVGMGGTVRLRYTIDTSGRAVGPYEILQASHELLAVAVRSAMPRSRFAPGVLDGRPVRVQHEEVFEFISDSVQLSPLPVIVLRSDSTPDHVPRTIIGRAFRDTAAAKTVTEAELTAAEQVALSAILKNAPRAVGADVVLCVDTADGASERLLRAIPGVRLMGRSDCPPTHAAMIARVDSVGRPVRPPAGWVDPHWLTGLTTRAWNRETIVVHAQMTHGMARVTHHCVAQRTGATWTATCRSDNWRIS
jgi:hypothetical protein